MQKICKDFKFSRMDIEVLYEFSGFELLTSFKQGISSSLNARNYVLYLTQVARAYHTLTGLGDEHSLHRFVVAGGRDGSRILSSVETAAIVPTENSVGELDYWYTAHWSLNEEWNLTV